MESVGLPSGPPRVSTAAAARVGGLPMSLGIMSALDSLAGRIERASLRRRPDWARPGCASPVWSAAAEALLRQHRAEPWLPLDPEFYVAAQPMAGATADPWQELACGEASVRYERAVRRAVAGLRRELRMEVRRAERRIAAGESARQVIARPDPRGPSAMARSILACRHGLPELLASIRPAARRQHRACPLYRPACKGLLPTGDYPVLDLAPGIELAPSGGTRRPTFSLN